MSGTVGTSQSYPKSYPTIARTRSSSHVWARATSKDLFWLICGCCFACSLTFNIPAFSSARPPIRSVKALDFSDVLEPSVESRLREVAEVSMGTELSVEDVANIKALCDQVPCGGYASVCGGY